MSSRRSNTALRGTAAALALAVVFALAASSAPSPAVDEKIPLHVSHGDSLLPDEQAVVKAVLLDYLSSLKARDYRRAGEHVDSETFLALTDSVVAEATNDTLPATAVRNMLFGVESRDSLRARPVPELFAALISATAAASPAAFDAIASAEIEILAMRRIDDRVVVAYQLTLPPAEPGGQPLTHVTAERLRHTPGGWKILFQR